MELTIDRETDLGQRMSYISLRNNIKYNDFEYSYYSFLCKEFELGPYVEEMFGSEYLSYESFKKNQYNLLEHIAKLHDRFHNAWIATSMNLGLDYVSLVNTTNDIIKTGLDRDIKKRIEELNGLHGEGFGIHEYAPTLSFLKTLCNNDMTGRRIIEVGSGQYGILALAHLQSLGADAYAIDETSTIDNKLIADSGINYIKGRWEDIGNKFGENSVDAIYINYMHPSPHYGGRFNSGHDSKWTEDIDAFEKHVASEMYRILKPNGLYVMRQLGSEHFSEYLYHNKENFNKYLRTQFRIEQCGKRENIIFIPETQKAKKPKFTFYWKRSDTYPINPEDKNIYFGNKLIVFQKRA